MFQTSKRGSMKKAAEEKANTERFHELFDTSNFVDWTPEETLFFFHYLVDHPHFFKAYTIKVEKDVLQYTTNKLLVEKVFSLITEYTDAFDPTELASDWQLIEYHVALFQHLQRFMRETFTKGEEDGQVCSER